jgi:hypothetical protein
LSLFLSVFILGWLLKEHSPLDNRLIPWVLSSAGIVLGFVLVDLSISGAVAGLAIAYMMMAFYDHFKGAAEVFFLRG